MKKDNKKLKIVCREFRKGLIGRGSSEGMCAVVSWALQGFLSHSSNIKTVVYESEVDLIDESTNHLYLVMLDGNVIDCTADQFDKKYPKVYIGEPLDIHKNGKIYNRNLKL